MATAIVLILLGVLGPLSAAQWRQGRWLRSATWIARRLSPQFLAGVPMFGVLLITIGISFVWPPGIVLVFVAAGALLWALFAATERRIDRLTPPQAKDEPPPPPPAAQRAGRPAEPPRGPASRAARPSDPNRPPPDQDRRAG